MAGLTEIELGILRHDREVTNRDTVYQDPLSQTSRTVSEWYAVQAWQIVADFYNLIPASPVDLWRPDISSDELKECIYAREYLPFDTQRQNTYRDLLGILQVIDTTLAITRENFQVVFPLAMAPDTYADIMSLAKRPATTGEGLYTVAQAGAYVSDFYGQDITDRNVKDSGRVPAVSDPWETVRPAVTANEVRLLSPAMEAPQVRRRSLEEIRGKTRT